MAEDLVSRIREFATGHGALVVSSSYLSATLDVDVRTIAAALRRHGVRPQDVGDTRGYVVDELVALPAAAGEPQTAVSSPAPPEMAEFVSAVDALSAGAGHDMTPALKAAGLL